MEYALKALASALLLGVLRWHLKGPPAGSPTDVSQMLYGLHRFSGTAGIVLLLWYIWK